MRIDVRLPLPGSSQRAAAAAASIASPPIAKLAATGELVLIELQGALEFDGLDDAGASQLIGTLTFDGPKQDRPVLLISHHRLYGKFVDLHQPLAVLQKHQRAPPKDIDSSPGAKRRWLEQPWTSDVEDDGGSESGRKRARREGEAGPSSSSPVSSPCRPSAGRAKGKDAPDVKAGAGGQGDDLDNEDDEEDEDSFSDTDNDDGKETDNDASQDDATTRTRPARSQRARARRPRVWYDVVCLIKRKILFAQRPEPVVKLAPESGVDASAVSSLGRPPSKTLVA